MKWEKLKKKLLRKREELISVEKTGDEAAGVVNLDQTSVGRLSRMNDMQSQAMSLEAQNRRKAQLSNIESALEKIEKGTYGICVYCQKEIDAARLEFDPSLLKCVNCANRG